MLTKVVLHYLKDGKLRTIIRTLEESDVTQVENMLDELSVL